MSWPAVFLCAFALSGTHGLQSHHAAGNARKPTALKVDAKEAYTTSSNKVCTNIALQKAHNDIGNRHWNALRTNPCMEDYLDMVDGLEQGHEDPEDVSEWLHPVEKREFRLNAKACNKHTLPSLLYIGMGHSGSTSLSEQLNQHPDLRYGKVKEHRFHFRPGQDNKARYKKEFPTSCNVNHTFDGTIGYHSRGMDTIKGFRSILSDDVKILFMFRDPVKYLKSVSIDYGGAHGKLASNLDCYADAVENWLKVFPREQFLFLRSEDYFEDPQTTIDKILSFTGLAPKRYSKHQLSQSSGRRRSSRAAYSQEFSQEDQKNYMANKKHLDCAYRLQNITGLKLGWEWLK